MVIDPNENDEFVEKKKTKKERQEEEASNMGEARKPLYETAPKEKGPKQDPIDRSMKGPSGQVVYTSTKNGKYYLNTAGAKVFVKPER